MEYLYNFPDWEGLLRLSFKEVNPDPYYYGQYVEKFNRANRFASRSMPEVNNNVRLLIKAQFSLRCNKACPSS